MRLRSAEPGAFHRESTAGFTPRICYLPSQKVAAATLARIRELGFDHLCVPPQSDDAFITRLATACRSHGLALLLDLQAGGFDRRSRAEVDGYRLIGLDTGWEDLGPRLARARQDGVPRFFAWTPGLAWDVLRRLPRGAFDGVFGSTAWWDGKAGWFIQEHELLRRLAPVIGVAAAPETLPTKQSLQLAAATGSGLFVPLPSHAAFDEDIKRATALSRDLGPGEQLLPLGTGPTRLQRGAQVIEIGDDVRVMPLLEEPPVTTRAHLDARLAATEPRIVIDNVSPTVAGGSFAAKRIVGRPIAVEADVFIDGHDVIAAELLWRPADRKDWQKAPMTALGNDRWRASFVPTRLGRWQFMIEAWLDELGTVRHAMKLKRDAGADISVEEIEERELVAKGAHHRAFALRSEIFPLEVERLGAAFASWYELFPRSATRDAKRHGTFDDVIADLPRIRDMGFDVLYFPPIHPIGTSHRKGHNNSLKAEPGDVGSPYAIGSPEGGHDALHRELGSFDDFRRLIAAAHDHGLELALDFAIQCSPDHPWLRQHPEWFKRRPDGTIKYAENPPKKYEDIVNVDFYAAGAVPALWEALRDVVLFWVDHGVRLFRVDNPHTKPLPFWHWMIAEVRGRHPDVVFLSEAFTKPKMMYRLAQVGL